MKINYTLHTHTVGFDGRNTAEDMVQTAISRGFNTIGFSNHFIVHPNIKKSKMYYYAVNGKYSNIYSDDVEFTIDLFGNHYENVRQLQQKYPDINILCGMEMDFFKYHGWEDKMRYAIRQLRPDYIIGAMHFIDLGDEILNIHDIKNAGNPGTGRLLREYYQNLIRLAGFDWRETGFKFNWLAHFDLPQKVGLSCPDMEVAAIQALRKNSVPIELNTSLIKNPRYHLNPAAMGEIKNMPVVISDDAHGIGRIGADFDEVFDMSVRAGVKNICTTSQNLYKFVNIRNR
ncbi:MAG: PHP domain-containing protein [Alphaproteobacteria bacterium]|nr:PHP domain-containing protein [Alphaproteobacteria bacterium]